MTVYDFQQPTGGRMAAFPQRGNYFPNPHPLSSLPFVGTQGGDTCYWVVRPTGDYGRDCELGREYAAHYLQYLRANPNCVQGLLDAILRDMSKTGSDVPDSLTRGIWVGFISFISDQLQARALQIDPFAECDAVRAEIERAEIDHG